MSLGAIVRGAVTLTDIADGLPTIAFIQTNENHTFPASSVGLVDTVVKNAFVNYVIVMIGNTQATAVTGAPEDNQYRLLSTSVTTSPVAGKTFTLTTGVDAAATGVGGGVVPTLKIQVNTMDNTVDLKQAIVTLNIQVKRPGQAAETFATQMIISKALGGSVELLTLSATRQFFTFEVGGTAPIVDAVMNSPIVLTALYEGSAAGNISWESYKNGTGAATDPLIGTVSSGSNSSTLTFTRGQWPSDASFITFKAFKGATVLDRVSVVRIDQGAAAYTLTCYPATGNFNFKNNTGATQIRAIIYKGGSELSASEMHTKWKFTFQRNRHSIQDELISGTGPIVIMEFDPRRAFDDAVPPNPTPARRWYFNPNGLTGTIKNPDGTTTPLTAPSPPESRVWPGYNKIDGSGGGGDGAGNALGVAASAVWDNDSQTITVIAEKVVA